MTGTPDDMDEIIGEFLVESHENLDRLDQEIVDLEQHSASDTLASIFRTIHTIKGTSGFLGFSKLERVTHVGENLLSKLRDGKLGVTADIISALLAMVDAVRQLLREIEERGEEGDGSFDDLVALLGRLNEGQAASPAAPPAAPAAPAPPAPAAPAAPATAAAPAAAAASAKAARKPRTRAAKPASPDAAAPGPKRSAPAPTPGPAPAQPAETADLTLGELLVFEGKAEPQQVEAALARQSAGDPRHVGELLVDQGAIAPTDVAEALAQQQERRAPAGSVSESSIRVDVSLLDDLMNLVGELVLARNQILQFTQTTGDAGILNTSQRLNLITTELQEGVMKTRMQPIENVWSKFPRVVRDLSVACAKQVRIEMEGKHTELDKTIIEAIKDPLTHLVRNAVDHGIEAPERRVAAGKPAEGLLRLRAFHEGGQVNIEISDDGAGMSPARIRAKAVERELITPEQAATMAPRDLLNLIFLPGFSTAASVSNISGRGVGMDVVRTNIEAIGGSIDIQSREGVGTTLKIKIPLTLAIIPALLVVSEGQRYAIPQVSLLELVRLDRREMGAGIEDVHGTPVYRLRGRLLPLVFLDEVLGLGRAADHDDDEVVSIVVLQADGEQFGLVVSEILDTAEIVVKPLGRMLKGVPAFAGATIMGDGRVALILDVLGLASMARVTSGIRDNALHGEADDGNDLADRQTLLLFSLGHRPLGLMLDKVERLEELDARTVEHAGGQRVVQYRDEILPLVFLAEELGLPSSHEAQDALRVVVCTTGGRAVGLVVDEIHDIVEQRLDLQAHTAVAGTTGSAVVAGRVTDMVDLPSILRAALPRLFEEVAA